MLPGSKSTVDDLEWLRRTGLAEAVVRHAAKGLPADCPYTFDQIVSQDWYPANRHGILDDAADA